MPGWLSQLGQEWPQFLAVFLGAALGAALTVWLGNRSNDRGLALQALTRLQTRLAFLWRTDADDEQWAKDVILITQDVQLITWHSRRWTRGRQATEESAERLISELARQATKPGGRINPVEWDPIWHEMGLLKNALRGRARDTNVFPEWVTDSGQGEEE